MRIPVLVVLALMTAGCGGGGRNDNAPVAASGPASTGDRVAALSEGQRNAVFIRALLDAGLDCQHVERSAPAGTAEGMPVWRVTCRGGGIWSIVIGADGNAQILPQAGDAAANQSGANASAAENRQR